MGADRPAIQPRNQRDGENRAGVARIVCCLTRLPAVSLDCLPSHWIVCRHLTGLRAPFRGRLATEARPLSGPGIRVSAIRVSEV